MSTNKYFLWAELRWKERQSTGTFAQQVAPEDFEFATISLTRHRNQTSFRAWPGDGWHRVGVKVEGHAANAIYDCYKSVLNETLVRDVEMFKIDGQATVSHQRNWDAVKDRAPVNVAGMQ